MSGKTTEPVLLTDEQIKSAMLSLLRPLGTKPHENVVIPRTYGPVAIKTNEEKIIESIFESCAFKCFMSCTLGKCCYFKLFHGHSNLGIYRQYYWYCIGYGLGGVIGLFSASVNPTITGPDAKQQTAREVFRDMKNTTMSHAKNFAIVGAMFASVECAIESVRRKQ